MTFTIVVFSLNLLKWLFAIKNWHLFLGRDLLPKHKECTHASHCILLWIFLKVKKKNGFVALSKTDFENSI